MSYKGISMTHLTVVVLLIVPVYYSVNAQSSTETPDSSFDLDWEIKPSTAIITVILVCFFSFLGFFSIYLRRCARERVAAATTAQIDSSSSPVAVTERPTRRRGIDQAVIQKFPTFTYSTVKALKIGKSALECAVCLSEFEDHETLRLLPTCNHVFHPLCIDTWLRSRVTCPVCRAKLDPETNGLVDDSLQSSELSNDPTQENSVTLLDEQQNHVVVNVVETESRDLPLQVDETVNRTSGKLPRSHSTGHSLIQPGDNTERYTLRLPEEVRMQVLECVKLESSSSNGVVLATVDNVDQQQVMGGSVNTTLDSVLSKSEESQNQSAMSPV
ncbi:hypothetical protein CMV_029437 [Castanea mollissima]|uniref:RING-type E3 ubiquitin transferase n=1 Tax=Castanea mollissima TaxID=60419 RepID=A0A8J4QBC8_9ROSI|nr:hypothetical protein CMV_029437 [Castanea mollissima]